MAYNKVFFLLAITLIAVVMAEKEEDREKRGLIGGYYGGYNPYGAGYYGHGYPGYYGHGYTGLGYTGYPSYGYYGHGGYNYY